MDIILVSKGTQVSKEDEDEKLIQIFESSSSLDELKSEIMNASGRYFLSWDSVEMKDRQGEIVPVKELKGTYQKYVNERGGAISDIHSNKVCGKTLAVKELKHPQLNKPALLTLNRIFDHYQADTEIWDKIKSGEYSGVSVGGQAHSAENVSIGGSMARKLGDIDIWEKSVCPKPANPLALNEAHSFAKGEYDLDQVAKELGIDWEKFDKEEFKKGMEVEMEHKDITNGSPILTGKIVLAHLKEMKDYYTKLATIEKKEVEIEIKKPFGEYADFKSCVLANKDKENPEGYCAELHHKITGKYPAEKNLKKEAIEKLDKSLDRLNKLNIEKAIITKLNKLKDTL